MRTWRKISGRAKLASFGGQFSDFGDHVEEFGTFWNLLEKVVDLFTNVTSGYISGSFCRAYKKMLAARSRSRKEASSSGNKNESKIFPSSPVPALTSPVPVTASTVSVKLSTYDGKTNWEVYKTQFSIISEANDWTEGVKACQLAASLRGEAVKILQTLPDTERLNLNSLYNALDLQFGQKYSKEYVRLQMKTRLQKNGESLQEYAFEVERLANLA
ncbi:uncharacterized protein TNCV_1387661 [Trichonephila clavipes]|nr:uncharacterized protein TNCV_1387661 [Trichonephila clavipes]